MISPRQELLRLLATKSFRLGDFKLSSGGRSDYYIDCRTTTLDARGAQLTGQVFLEEIQRRGWNPEAIGGLTMGADPIVVAVAVSSGTLNGFLVRKAEKQHGTGQRVEGFRGKGARVVIVDDVCTTGGLNIHGGEAARGVGVEGFRGKGARVVIVDDVCTTGGSTIQAIEAAREFGFEVVGVMCLVEREEAHGRAEVEKAAAPALFVAVFTANDVRMEHIALSRQPSAVS